MTKSALLGAAALLSAMAATPVTAQEVIYNPGYCAQFYPNANCQNKGPNNPYTGDYQRRNEMRGAYARCVCPERRSLRAGCGVLSWPGRPPALLLLMLLRESAEQTTGRRSAAGGLIRWRYPSP